MVETYAKATKYAKEAQETSNVDSSSDVEQSRRKRGKKDYEDYVLNDSISGGSEPGGCHRFFYYLDWNILKFDLISRCQTRKYT